MTKLEKFIETYRGHLTSNQCTSMLHGVTLTDQLREIVEQALGLRPHLAEAKRNTLIQSQPGAGKTFTVKATAKAHNINLIEIAGQATPWALVAKLVKILYKLNPNPAITDIPIWIDDCDSLFTDEKVLNLMKIMLDTDEPRISWDTSVLNHISSAKKSGDTDLANALEYFSNGGVGIEVPLDKCRFLITTNKQFKSVRDISARTPARTLHEIAIRDRVVYRVFDLTNDHAWGWMASVAINEDIFKDNNFSLTDEQMLLLLKTFHYNWDRLTSCSMRAVKDAAAVLYNNPDKFTDQFNQNFCIK